MIKAIFVNFTDDSTLAATYLRQAIPAMVKHKISPNPLNYTLWYSYYSQKFPSLNDELDCVVERFGTCPPKVGEDLFVRHIGSENTKNEEQIEHFQQTVTHLVSNLSDSLDQSAKETTVHSKALQANIDNLESHKGTEEIKPMLKELNASATAIQSANQIFYKQVICAQQEINVLKAELEKSKKEAHTDSLTGLSNRRVLEYIYRQNASQTGSGRPTIIIMDIDHFKMFNDTYGHLLGDQVLKFVGGLLEKECPDSLAPVRFGGEEFAILCPEFDLEQAGKLAEHIRQKLANTVFNNKKEGQQLPPVTASFGVAAQELNEDLSQILERADKALYIAKNQGRNQVQFAAAE